MRVCVHANVFHPTPPVCVCCAVQVLKAERPDVDAKRSDLLKLQGRELERLVLWCRTSLHTLTSLIRICTLLYILTHLCTLAL